MQVELVCRVTTVLLQTHYNQLTTTPVARPMLTVLKDILHERVKVIIEISTLLHAKILLLLFQSHHVKLIVYASYFYVNL